MDDDGTMLHMLIASSTKANIWEQVSFNWPEADYEEVIARKALRLIFTHCMIRRDNTEQESPLPPEAVKERFNTVRILKPVVRTSFMEDKVMLVALANRPEFANWGIKIGGVNGGSDLDLVVGHVLSTLIWTFKLIDHDSGALLDQGTVIAFSDGRAATRIAASAVKQIAARRPLHNRTIPSKTSASVVYPGAHETWVVQALSEDMNKQFPGKMRLSVQVGNIVFADLQGHVLFSIPRKSILDSADSKFYTTLGDNLQLDDDDWNGCGEGCIGLIFYLPVVAVMNQFHIHHHLIDIAWTQDQAIRITSLQVSKGDYRSLLSILGVLSGTGVQDTPLVSATDEP